MTTRQKKRRRKYVLLGFIVVVLGGMTFAALRQKREPVVRVETERVERRDLTERVVANGRIQPTLQVKISAEVSGEIIRLPIKEGQAVRKGELLVTIKPDVYVANRESAQASYLASVSGRNLAEANLKKAALEFQRNEALYEGNLISEVAYVEYRTLLEVARAQLESATHQVAVAKASLDRAEEELAKTTIYSPLDGTVSQLNSELGERVVGTAMMTGTEIMTVADLDQMEARVDIGEIDIPLIALEQRATLEVDAFRDREFRGVVSEIANSAKGLGSGGGAQAQEGTKFEVRIRVTDREAFRPGMTVTAEIETRYRTNVLAVPIQSVTTRPPPESDPEEAKGAGVESSSGEVGGNGSAAGDADPPVASESKKGQKEEARPKHLEVVFVVEEDRARMMPVKRGISDDAYTEIEEGLEEGQEVVSGGYKAISKDLEDGKKVQRSEVEVGDEKP